MFCPKVLEGEGFQNRSSQTASHYLLWTTRLSSAVSHTYECQMPHSHVKLWVKLRSYSNSDWLRSKIIHMVVLHVVRLNFNTQAFFFSFLNYTRPNSISLFQPYPLLYPLALWVLALSHRGLWLKSSPTKWNTTSGTRYIISRLVLMYSLFTGDSSCCPQLLLYSVCVGHWHPFLICHHMELENNVKICKNTQRGDKNVTIKSANINLKN